jgi:hypothetical protein
VTEGPVTAVKSTRTGMPVIQTQAPASPGNSGGPVLTDGGNAVGVLVANAVGSDGVAAQGQNFVIPASEVLDMLERNGVTPEESDTTAAYADAVDAFYADRYREALPLFEKVEVLYPAHPFAQKFITDSKTAIDAGLDKTPAPDEGSSLRGPMLAVGGGALLMLLAGVGAWLLTRRRQRAAVVGIPSAAAYVGWTAPPVPAQDPTRHPVGLGPDPTEPNGPPPQPVWDPRRGWYLPDQAVVPASDPGDATSFTGPGPDEAAAEVSESAIAPERG